MIGVRHALVVLLIAWCGLGAFAPAAPAQTAAASILMYHRFGENAYPSTNIRIEQFEAHLAELTSGRYNVLPLPTIVEALIKGTPLPDRTVAITVDDAYESAHREAWPRLRRAKLPFSVFVATDPVDGRTRTYMNWDQVRDLAKDGVYIGGHTDGHQHLPDLDNEAVAAAIARGNERIAAEVGHRPTIFAYPYGEFSNAVIREVAKAGMVVAFGQHSGVAHAGGPLYALPRFPMSESFGDMTRFRMAVNAMPFPVADLTPTDSLIHQRQNPPAVGFTIASEFGDLGRIGCWSSVGKLRTERLGDRRIELRVDQSLPPGRARFSCTLPASDGRVRWLSVPFVVRN